MTGASSDGGPRERRTLRACAGVAAVGALVCVAGAVIAPGAVATSYLVAYTATLAVVLGTLLLVMIAHLAGATWFVVLRRQAEAVLGMLPALAALALPLVLAPRAFWPWAGPLDALAPSVRSAVRARGAYLEPPFFAARAIVYWIVWLVLAELLRRASRRQDGDPDPAVGARLRVVSAAGLPLVALTLTFASVDWMMSLSPAWSSSVYGVYYFAGAMVGALALLAVLASARRRTGASDAPTAEHLHALGKLTLTFVLFWMYIWFSQLLIVWIADIPREVPWYLARLRAGWNVLGAVVLTGAFAVPFLALLTRGVKRSGAALAAVGVWLLVAHYLDVYWLVAPDARSAWTAARIVWDIGALALVAGAATALGIWRHAGEPPVPVGDPMLERSLRYQAR
jgi:hypothetical protein